MANNQENPTKMSQQIVISVLKTARGWEVAVYNGANPFEVPHVWVVGDQLPLLDFQGQYVTHPALTDEEE